jgi:peptidyl-dipeptidase A
MQRRIVAFRPRWKGRRVGRSVLQRLLREEPRERLRRAAYHALEPLYRPLEGSLRELVRLRNEHARTLGFRTYAEMLLGFNGLSPGRLEGLIEEVSVPARRRLRELRSRFHEKTGRSDWFPWDFLYAREAGATLPRKAFPQDKMLPTALETIGRWGFATDRLHFRIAFHDSSAGGMTLAPDPPRDVRILVHPTGGWLAYMILLHEVGHAVHSASIRAPRHLLRWHENIPGFGPLHEGLAGLFEDVASAPGWLLSRPGLRPAEVDAFVLAHRFDSLYDAAWHASWLRVEQALYREPERDPMPSALRFDRRLFGYDDYRPLSFVDAFFVESPVAASNYLLAILFGHQLRAAMARRFGEPLWPNRRVGPWLARTFFAGGSSYDWLERVREATGRPFGARALLEADRTSR